MKRWIALVVALAAAVVILFIKMPISRATLDEYKQLTNPLLGKEEKGVKFPSKQHRENVRKDLLVTSQEQRLHTRLRSEFSDLVIKDQELIEKMHGITCLMQAERRPSFQVVRAFEATSGIYAFSKNRFTADQVHLQRFLIPGNVLPDEVEGYSPTMKGLAKSIILQFGNEVDFKAKHLKVTLFSSEDAL